VLDLESFLTPHPCQSRTWAAFIFFLSAERVLSNQANQNRGRHPKEFVSDIAAAKAIVGSQTIQSSQTLREDFEQVFLMRDIDTEVTAFWQAFAATRIYVYSPYAGDPEASPHFSRPVRNAHGVPIPRPRDRG
jgi:hypothetical protein